MQHGTLNIRVVVSPCKLCVCVCVCVCASGRCVCRVGVCVCVCVSGRCVCGGGVWGVSVCVGVWVNTMIALTTTIQTNTRNQSYLYMVTDRDHTTPSLCALDIVRESAFFFCARQHLADHPGDRSINSRRQRV